MGFDNRGVSEIDALIIEGLQDNFNRNLRILPKSFVRILSKVVAGVFVLLEKSIGWFYLQLFPDTASFDETTVLGRKIRPLVKLGEQWGVGSPLLGSAWRGRARLDVLSRGNVIEAGTQLKCDLNGLLYVVEDSVSLDGDAAEASLYCEETGEAGNIPEGAELKFVTPLAFVARTARVLATSEAGTDDETEAEYRARVRRGYGAKTQGGSLSDYRDWASDAEGVLSVYPYPSDDNPAHVLLYVSGNPSVYPGRVADRALCVRVGKCCTFDPATGKANRKPVTDVLDPNRDGTYLNVMPVSVVPFEVRVTGASGNVAAFAKRLREDAASYLLRREPFIRGLSDESENTGTILRNAFYGLAASAGAAAGAVFGEVSVLARGAEVSSYELGRGELCALSALVVDGEEYEA